MSRCLVSVLLPGLAFAATVCFAAPPVAVVDIIDLTPGPAATQAMWLPAALPGDPRLLAVHGPGVPGPFRSNGSVSGTLPLYPEELNVLDARRVAPEQGRLWFLLGWRPSGAAMEVWITDGTPDGTRLAAQLPRTVQLLGTFGRTIVFAVEQAPIPPAEGEPVIPCLLPSDLWAWDAEHGLRLLDTGHTPSEVHAFLEPVSIELDGGLYFPSYKGGCGGGDYGVWRTDGTPGGTLRIATASEAPRIGNVGDRLFIAADGALWTTAGDDVTLVQDGVRAEAMMGAQGRLFFRGCTAEIGYEPWVSDGTPDGTYPLADLAPGAASSIPSGFTVLDDDVLFLTEAPACLYAVRGGSSDVQLLHGFPDAVTYATHSLAAAHDRVLAVISFANKQRELWESDGTAAGTVFVADIPYDGYDHELNLVTAGPYAGFRAFGTGHGMELHIAAVRPEYDDDHDGLTRLEELRYGTDPFVADTDGDGISDGIEVAFGRDPLTPEPNDDVPVHGWALLVLLPACAWGVRRTPRRRE